MTETTVIKFNDAVRMVFLAIHEKGPDYVYEPVKWDGQCKNVDVDDEGNPVYGCIVGTGLVLAGYVTLQELYKGCRSGSVTPLRGWLEVRGVTMTDRAQNFLNRVQKMQDSRKSWLTAVAKGMEWAYCDTNRDAYAEDESKISYVCCSTCGY